MNVDVLTFKQWLLKTYEKINQNKQRLTELDQKIGDGDHGINMERGFRKVKEKIEETDYECLEDIAKDVAMTVISTVGGASGPLYGTAFLRMAPVFAKNKKVDAEIFIEGLVAGLQGIQARGKAEVGEKTLVDVWTPVLEKLKEKKILDGDLIEQTAKEAAEKTKELIAAKGRAAYFKEKSLGHIDPGAMSSYYLFSALAAVVGNEQS